MGWGRYFLLGDFGQQLDLADHKDDLDRMRNDLHSAREVSAYSMQEVRSLAAENDQLKLYLAALIRLLVSKGIVTQQEVVDLVDLVDEEDGTSDGRFTGPLG